MKIEIPDQSSVIGRFGPDKQAMVHCEELAELIQAVSKMRRVKNSGKNDREAYSNLVEEMADVLVSIKQMQEIYGITDNELQIMVEKKWQRQEARMHEPD